MLCGYLVGYLECALGFEIDEFCVSVSGRAQLCILRVQVCYAFFLPLSALDMSRGCDFIYSVAHIAIEYGTDRLSKQN